MTFLVFMVILALAGLIYALVQWLRIRKEMAVLQETLQKKNAEHTAAVKKWTEYTNAVKAEIKRLSKWKSVADADERAAQLLQDAQAKLDNAKAQADGIKADADGKAAQLLRDAQANLDNASAQANRIRANADEQAEARLQSAREEAERICSNAKETSKELKLETQAALASATAKAAEIIAAAENRAKEVAGSAFDALKNADLYEKTATAMKNIVYGYGDQYLIPGRSLLDDLAEEFSHENAGKKLKEARAQTAAMIRNRTAAQCEYVEEKRRNSAVEFVIDAFNGKVDSILSRARHDNYGTLRQQIVDAFTVVNHNGQAFREARITEEYLSARLDELRWAIVLHELRLEEREEQRKIKEQIREEEKARREYERAIKEAAKEEDMLRKAMDKAQQQIQQATSEQRQKYEQQLQELSQKLKEAEERNQRALSMAQQTKRGHVYIISNIGSFGENVYKVGLTRRLEPLDRIRELGDSSVPFEFDVHAVIFNEDAPALENHLHKHFVMMQMNKVNYRKEFFKAELAHIREEVEKLGLTAKWTMAAEAAEYRETLAIEKAIGENPAMREAWLNRQLLLEPATAEDLEEPETVAQPVEYGASVG
jgi:DNA repair exonuclease SbcCD ATPase subunit